MSLLLDVPDETLLVIFQYAGKQALTALSCLNRSFSAFCNDRTLKLLLLQGRCLRAGEKRNRETFFTLVNDSRRNRRNTLQITPSQLEHLTVIVETYPDLVCDTSVSPLFLTRNPVIFDLLLRHGADGEALSFEGKSKSQYCFSERQCNLVLLWQLSAYGTQILKGERDEASCLMREQYVDLAIHLLEHKLIKIETIKDPLLFLIYPSTLSHYFRNLALLREGLSPLARGALGVNIVQYAAINKCPLFFKLIMTYCNYPLARYQFEGKSEEVKQVHTRIEQQIEKGYSERKQYLRADYVVLKQLHLEGRMPYWKERAFWTDKLVHDHPEAVRSSLYSKIVNARKRYRQLCLTPIITFLARSGLKKLSLDYHTGRGLIICRYFLLGSGADALLPVQKIEVLGLSCAKGIKGLYGFYPEGSLTELRNSTKELLMVKEAGEDNDFYIPTPFCPYVMKLKNETKTFYLQFPRRAFFKGYLLLCSLLAVSPSKHCSGLFKVTN